MHLKVFLKLKKNLKTLSSGQIYKKTKKTQKTPKKPKKQKKPKIPKKNQKNPLGWFKKKKNRVFSNPCLARRLVQVEDGGYEGAQRTLRYGQGDAEEGVEGVGLAQAGRAGQARPELGLQHHEKQV
jgi:hypothetical protein